MVVKSNLLKNLIAIMKRNHLLKGSAIVLVDYHIGLLIDKSPSCDLWLVRSRDNPGGEKSITRSMDK